MGRRCTICDHPDVGEINRHIIMGDMQVSDMELEYGVSRDAIYRHKKNHLGKVIEEARREVRDQAKQDYISSIKAYTMIIDRLPDLIKKGNPSFTQIIEAIKGRSELLGERIGSPEVKVVWGKGIKEEKEKPEDIEDKEEATVVAETDDKGTQN